MESGLTMVTMMLLLLAAAVSSSGAMSEEERLQLRSVYLQKLVVLNYHMFNLSDTRPRTCFITPMTPTWTMPGLQTS